MKIKERLTGDVAMLLQQGTVILGGARGTIAPNNLILRAKVVFRPHVHYNDNLPPLQCQVRISSPVLQMYTFSQSQASSLFRLNIGLHLMK